ncbi:Putative LOC101744750, partial [Caligus rogercresseyi]
MTKVILGLDGQLLGVTINTPLNGIVEHRGISISSRSCAITRSVEDLLNQEKFSKNIIIRSDSQSAIAALLNPLTTSEVVKNCKK